MTEPHQTIRVFVNAVGVDVPAGATALDALRKLSPSEAEAAVRGDRVITDSRGLPVAPQIAVQAGSIFRTVSGRATRGASAHDAQLLDTDDA